MIVVYMTDRGRTVYTVKIEYALLAENVQLIPPHLKPVMHSPIPGFITVFHAPEPDRPSVITFALIVGLSATSSEIGDRIWGRIELLDLEADVLLRTTELSGAIAYRGESLSNEEDLTASALVLDYRNTPIMHLGQHRIDILVNSIKHHIDFRVVLSKGGELR